MLIVCPSCVSAYRVSAERLGQRTTVARCAHCRETFPIAASDDPEEGAVAPPVTSPVSLGRAAGLRKPLAVGPATVYGTRPVHALHPLPLIEGRRERSAARFLSVAVLVLGLVAGGTACRDRLLAAAPTIGPWLAGLGLLKGDGLVLRDVQTALGAEGSTKVLTLEGRITNALAHEAAVPDLRIVVRDAAAQSVYTWTTPAPRASLKPGEAIAFRSRLVSPPSDGKDIVVSFAETYGDPTAIRVKDAQ